MEDAGRFLLLKSGAEWKGSKCGWLTIQFDAWTCVLEFWKPSLIKGCRPVYTCYGWMTYKVLDWGRPAAKVVWHCAFRHRTHVIKKQGIFHNYKCACAKKMLHQHPTCAHRFARSQNLEHYVGTVDVLHHASEMEGGGEDEEDEEGWRAWNARRWLDGAIHGRGVLKSSGLPANSPTPAPHRV